MDSNLTLALIGTSGIAPTYAALLHDLDDVSLAWVHSRSLERAKAFAARSGIPHCTATLATLFSDPQLDGVLIVTEPHRHLDIAFQALAAGKHMLIEKPLDVDLQKAAHFCAAAQDFQGVISVVSQKRFDPVLQAMKAHLSHEAAGLPKTVQLSMLWHRDAAYYAKGTGWRTRHSAVFLNQGIHWLDVLNWLFGVPSRIQVISRKTRNFLECADQTTAILDYPDKTSAAICGGTFCSRSYPDRFTIYSPTHCLDYGEYFLQRYPAPVKTPWYHRLKHPFTPPAPPPGEPFPDLLALQLQDFLEAIRQNRPPVTTLDAAWHALNVAHALSELPHEPVDT
ncbi:hypothetical protein GF339_05405 [candidate division KSB3 bacterium]|uniref:Oxidoreductase n=1 Tax=candidate division KSB3 bacterium TaxID=2044937 RepID=A0A9D5Q4R7_9BACT|nr:hypothetical protein [candidate division KSB3 bacterium]MBD3323999.1 hypothetical protein [candidate division KSB3 bacterium]